MADADQINTAEHTGVDAKEYASFALEINLITEGPTGKTPRELWVLAAGAGVLTVETKNGDRTFSGGILEAKNIPLTLGILKIRNTTTVGRVLVIW